MRKDDHQSRSAGKAPEGDTADDGERRVGVEVEFGGLNAQDAAHVIKDLLGGEISTRDAHRYELKGTSLGDIRVELDSKYVHSGDTASAFEKKMRRFAGDVSGSIVPTELVTDPLPVSSLSRLDTLLDKLAKAGAVGTEQPHLAYGVHLNIEWKDHDIRSILRVLQAYLLMAPALRMDIEPDTTRTLLPFIGRFPKDYEAKVLDPDYNPDFGQFVADYCEANPTKNRELDLLPLLASIDEGTVENALKEKPAAVRPAFHYRLPNSLIGADDWSILKEWERWLCVEMLANDEDNLLKGLSDVRDRRGSHDPVGTLRRMFARVIGK
ncbi:Putative amidoligase enzyme [Stappia sp. ES.058]|nr:Putative amidoligase enzyme [Stappia sp. ES.058]